MKINSWQDLSALITLIVTIIGQVIVILSVLYAKKQLDENTLSRRMQLLQNIIAQIGTEEIRDLRKWLYEAPKTQILDVEKVKKISVAYDRIAFMLINDSKSLKLYREFQGKEVIFVWEKVKKTIDFIRKKRINPEYCIHFEKLYNEIKLSEK